MRRLGEHLVQAGLIKREQLAEALRAQVVWGARIGTNLVELGHLEIDDLSRTLGRQLKMPSALASHFERADPALQKKLPKDVAMHLHCIPLVLANQYAVVAIGKPLSNVEMDVIATHLGVSVDKLVPSITAELRIHYQLEKVYGVPRDQRFIRAAGTRSEDSQVFQLPPPVDPAHEKKFGRDEDEISVVDGIPQPVSSVTGHNMAGDDDDRPAPKSPLSDARQPPQPFDPLDRERRSYLKTLADMLADRPDEQHSVVAHVEHLAANARAPLAAPKTLDAAAQAIFRGADREQVAQRVIDAIEKFIPAARAAIFLVVRGQAAVSWTSFCRDGTKLPPIAVPLDHPGLVPAVIKRKSVARIPSGDLGTIDYLLLASLGARHGELACAPIMIGDQVICVIGLATGTRGLLDGLEQITMATGAAFARLMRQAGAKA
ncbi:MAG: hypothetical protein AB7T06_40050 [Kofleriaceae bacterium]